MKLTWTLTHAYFANMGGFVYTLPPGSPSGPLTARPAAHPLTGIHIAAYLDAIQYPSISEAEIKDKSKTDGLGKVFSVFQISHLMLSLIVRRAQGLPIAQLEILTLAFSVCGVATYAVYWYKPKDISVPVHLGELDVVLPGPQVTDRVKQSFQTFRPFDSFWRVLVNDSSGTKDGLHRIPNDNIPLSSTGFTHTTTLLLAFLSALFSSLHAIAWNFDFPTAAEATIWHACTILTILVPPLGLLGIPLSQATWIRGNEPRDFLYASARVLRELSWHLDDVNVITEVDMVRRDLEALYDTSLSPSFDDDSTRKLFRELLWPDDGRFKHGESLRQKMLAFAEKGEPFQHRPDLDLPRNYALHLRQLFLLMDGQGPKKMVEKVAKTNVFPRHSLPAAFNSWFLYVAMGSYCMARLVLVAISLSSLRAMPQGVYNATWAQYIPAI